MSQTSRISRSSSIGEAGSGTGKAIRDLAHKLLNKHECEILKAALRHFRATKSVPYLCTSLSQVVNSRRKTLLLSEIRHMLPDELRPQFEKFCQGIFEKFPDNADDSMRSTENDSDNKDMDTSDTRDIEPEVPGVKTENSAVKSSQQSVVKSESGVSRPLTPMSAFTCRTEDMNDYFEKRQDMNYENEFDAEIHHGDHDSSSTDLGDVYGTNSTLGGKKAVAANTDTVPRKIPHENGTHQKHVSPTVPVASVHIGKLPVSTTDVGEHVGRNPRNTSRTERPIRLENKAAKSSAPSLSSSTNQLHESRAQHQAPIKHESVLRDMHVERNAAASTSDLTNQSTQTKFLRGASLPPNLKLPNDIRVPKSKKAMPSRSSSSVTINTQAGKLVEIRKVKLTRTSGQSLGFSIRGGKEVNSGVYVSDVVKDGQSDKQGLKVGDRILKVNDVSFRTISHDEAVQVVKRYARLVMYVTSSYQPKTDGGDQGESQWLGSSKTGKLLTVQAATDGWLGCSIKGGTDYGMQPMISNVDKGSPADKAGVKTGDLILRMNGLDITSLTHGQIVSLATSSRTLKLFIKPFELPQRQDEARDSLHGRSSHETTPTPSNTSHMPEPNSPNPVTGGGPAMWHPAAVSQQQDVVGKPARKTREKRHAPELQRCQDEREDQTVDVEASFPTERANGGTTSDVTKVSADQKKEARRRKKKSKQNKENAVKSDENQPQQQSGDYSGADEKRNRINLLMSNSSRDRKQATSDSHPPHSLLDTEPTHEDDVVDSREIRAEEMRQEWKRAKVDKFLDLNKDDTDVSDHEMPDIELATASVITPPPVKRSTLVPTPEAEVPMHQADVLDDASSNDDACYDVLGTDIVLKSKKQFTFGGEHLNSPPSKDTSGGRGQIFTDDSEPNIQPELFNHSRSPPNSHKARIPSSGTRVSQSPPDGAHKAQSPSSGAHKAQSPQGGAHKALTPPGDAHKAHPSKGRAHKAQSPAGGAHKAQSPPGGAHKAQSSPGGAHKAQSPVGSAIKTSPAGARKSRSPQLGGAVVPTSSVDDNIDSLDDVTPVNEQSPLPEPRHAHGRRSMDAASGRDNLRRSPETRDHTESVSAERGLSDSRESLTDNTRDRYHRRDIAHRAEKLHENANRKSSMNRGTLSNSRKSLSEREERRASRSELDTSTERQDTSTERSHTGLDRFSDSRESLSDHRQHKSRFNGRSDRADRVRHSESHETLLERRINVRTEKASRVRVTEHMARSSTGSRSESRESLLSDRRGVHSAERITSGRNTQTDGTDMDTDDWRADASHDDTDTDAAVTRKRRGSISSQTTASTQTDLDLVYGSRSTPGYQHSGDLRRVVLRERPLPIRSMYGGVVPPALDVYEVIRVHDDARRFYEQDVRSAYPGRSTSALHSRGESDGLLHRHSQAGYDAHLTRASSTANIRDEIDTDRTLDDQGHLAYYQSPRHHASAYCDRPIYLIQERPLPRDYYSVYNLPAHYGMDEDEYWANERQYRSMELLPDAYSRNETLAGGAIAAEEPPYWPSDERLLLPRAALDDGRYVRVRPMAPPYGDSRYYDCGDDPYGRRYPPAARVNPDYAYDRRYGHGRVPGENPYERYPTTGADLPRPDKRRYPQRAQSDALPLPYPQYHPSFMHSTPEVDVASSRSATATADCSPIRKPGPDNERMRYMSRSVDQGLNQPDIFRNPRSINKRVMGSLPKLGSFDDVEPESYPLQSERGAAYPYPAEVRRLHESHSSRQSPTLVDSDGIGRDHVTSAGDVIRDHVIASGPASHDHVAGYSPSRVAYRTNDAARRNAAAAEYSQQAAERRDSFANSKGISQLDRGGGMIESWPPASYREVYRERYERGRYSVDESDHSLLRAAPQPDMRGSQPDLRVLQPDLRGLQPDLRGLQPDLRGLQADQRGLQPDVRELQSDIRGLHPGMRSPQPEMRGSKPDMRASQPDLRGLQPGMRSPQPEMRGSKPDMRGSQPDLRGSQSDLRASQSDMRGSQSLPRCLGMNFRYNEEAANNPYRPCHTETFDQLAEQTEVAQPRSSRSPRGYDDEAAGKSDPDVFGAYDQDSGTLAPSTAGHYDHAETNHAEDRRHSPRAEMIDASDHHQNGEMTETNGMKPAIDLKTDDGEDNWDAEC